MKKRLLAFILIAVSLAGVVFAGTSLSKYLLQKDETIEGTYTDFRLSHNGDGQSIAMTEMDGNSVGYLNLTVRNEEGGYVSPRDITFAVRSPTPAEIAAGYVSDAFGNHIELHETSANYTVDFLDVTGDIIKDGDKILLEKDILSEVSFHLKITRSGVISTESEGLCVIIETAKPYQTVLVFHVRCAAQDLIFNTSESTHFGFRQVALNVRSIVRYHGFDSPNLNPAEIILKADGLTFDELRFRESSDLTYTFDRTQNTVTIRIPEGSDLNLYFYRETGSASSIQLVSAKLGTGAVATTAGVTNGLIYSAAAG